LKRDRVKFFLGALPHNPHIQNVALALYEAGALAAYRSGLVDNYRHGWSRTVRKWIGATAPRTARRLERRRITTIPDHLIHSGRVWDGLLMLAHALDLDPRLQDILWESVEHRFDDGCAAALARAQCDGFVGVEHGCLESVRAARSLGKRVVVAFLSPHHETLRECVFGEYAKYPQLMTPYVERLLRLMPRRTARKDEEARLADLVLTASRFTSQSLVKHTGFDARKIMCIPLGGPPPVARADLPESSAGPVRFLYSGPVSVRKGVHYLLEAWRSIGAAPHATLDLFGSMQLPIEALEETARGVTFHGHVAPSDLRNAYRAASVLVFPTLCDGFGLVVQEALAQGVPVITTTNAGAADLIEDGRNGFVVAPANLAALAEKMQWCITHPQEISRMRLAALETAQAWTWNRFRESFRDNLRTKFGPAAAGELPLSA
jgi:glycosyltransferase involved in cell wall biosynthesis